MVFIVKCLSCSHHAHILGTECSVSASRLQAMSRRTHMYIRVPKLSAHTHTHTKFIVFQ